MIKFYREFLILLLVSICIQTFSAERIRIAVVDTGITLTDANYQYFCPESRDFSGTGLTDRHGHGTNVSGIILRNLDTTKYCVLMLKYYDTATTGDHSLIPYLQALQYLKTVKNLQFLNLSLSSEGESPLEKVYLTQILRNGVKIVVAAGNEYKDFDKVPCTAFPTCYSFTKNFYVVGASDLLVSNKNGPVKYYEKGLNVEGFGVTLSGSSQATAIFSNKLIRGLIK